MKLLSMPTIRTSCVLFDAPTARSRVVAMKNPMRKLLRSMFFMLQLPANRRKLSSDRLSFLGIIRAKDRSREKSFSLHSKRVESNITLVSFL